MLEINNIKPTGGVTAAQQKKERKIVMFKKIVQEIAKGTPIKEVI